MRSVEEEAKEMEDKIKQKIESDRIKEYFYNQHGIFFTDNSFGEFYTSGKAATKQCNEMLVKFRKNHPDWSPEKAARKIAEKMKLKRLDKALSMDEVILISDMAEAFYNKNILNK